MTNAKRLTIFTPTYNRAGELSIVYNSIIGQEYLDDIEWVIMDDGSNDGTKELVLTWIRDYKVRIKYYWQDNQGRFAAYNNAMEYFDGELVALVDSDNFLKDGAVKKLLDLWGKIKERNLKVSGIIAYMTDETGAVYGNEFPEGINIERIYTLYDKYGLYGDKFLAFRRNLVLKYKYPIFKGEKFGGDSIVFNRMNDEFPMYIFRQIILTHGIGTDSITSNLLKHHLLSPNGMREHYKDALEHEHYNKKSIVKHAIGYVGYSILTRKKFSRIISESPKKVMTLLMYPFGFIFYIRCAMRVKRLSNA